MRKLLFAGFIWEVIRFLYMYVFASATQNLDLFMWMNAQQIVTALGMFFLAYDFDKYRHYAMLMFAAKLFGILADFIFIFKLGSAAKSLDMTSFLIPAFALVLDLFFGCILFFASRKPEDEE